MDNTQHLGRGVKRTISYYKGVAERVASCFKIETSGQLFTRPTTGKGNKIYFGDITSHTLPQRKRIVEFINGSEITSFNSGQSKAKLIARITPTGALVVECL